MVEISHRVPEPAELVAFRAEHPSVGPADFDSPAFQSIKRQIKRKLSQDQSGLCAYCESTLKGDDGQVDHIKPRRGAQAHPGLTFVYTNFAHSCVSAKHCGQKKGDRLLPIEPRSGCNARFALSTDGFLDADRNQSPEQQKEARLTLDLLGLNYPELVLERKRWLESALSFLEELETMYPAFMAAAPFRHTLKRILP